MKKLIKKIKGSFIIFTVLISFFVTIIIYILSQGGFKETINHITKKKNRSYTSGSTKRDQIDILEKRYQYFNIISESTIDSLKKIIFKDFALFSLTRKEVIEKCRISKLLYLIARRKMYASKVGVIVDLLYAFGFEKFICFIIGWVSFSSRVIYV